MQAVLLSTGRFLDRVALVLTQAAVATMVVVVALQVVWRYFLKSPIIWAEELARYSLVWMTFIGAAAALRAGQLVCVDLLVTKFPSRLQRAISIAVVLANIALLGLLFYMSIRLLGSPGLQTQFSPALRIPMRYVYFAMPIGLGLMVLQSLLQLFDLITQKEGGKQ